MSHVIQEHPEVKSLCRVSHRTDIENLRNARFSSQAFSRNILGFVEGPTKSAAATARARTIGIIDDFSLEYARTSANMKGGQDIAMAAHGFVAAVAFHETTTNDETGSSSSSSVVRILEYTLTPNAEGLLSAGYDKQLGTDLPIPTRVGRGNNLGMSGNAVMLAVRSIHGNVTTYWYDSDQEDWFHLGTLGGRTSAVEGALVVAHQAAVVAVSGTSTTIATTSSSNETTSVNSSKQAGWVQLHRYNFETENWELEADLVDEEDESFGYSLALNADATVLAVGNPNALLGSGVVQIYKASNLKNDTGGLLLNDTSLIWTHHATLDHPSKPLARFGHTVAISDPGDLIAVGGPNYTTSSTNNEDEKLIGNGGVWLYQDWNQSWTMVGELYGDSSQSHLGSFLSLNENATLMALGPSGDKNYLEGGNYIRIADIDCDGGTSAAAFGANRFLGFVLLFWFLCGW